MRDEVVILKTPVVEVNPIPRDDDVAAAAMVVVVVFACVVFGVWRCAVVCRDNFLS